jgi:hypothetical protein
MTLIRETLTRDLSQRIEEVVKVEQEDEATVYGEITDYVATDRIKEHYRTLLREIAEGKNSPHDGIGIWVSGFFGSGKSSFAKNLGYVLSNPKVLDVSAAELFKEQVNDSQIGALVDSILTRISTEAILFDVRAHTSALRGEGRITELMYKALLKHLDYADDFDLAELEIDLEQENRLGEFEKRFQDRFATPWREARTRSEKYNRASALLHDIDPQTYTSADSWVSVLKARRADITVDKFADRLFELTARRRPGKTLFFVLDEVGAYVARSADKIEDLRSVVERIGMKGKNLVQRGQAIAPIWIVVTSQEKLDEVVAAFDSKRVELARLQDRFKFLVDLAPADIREVASRRVLAKTDAAIVTLRELFRRHDGQLNAALRWEQTARRSQVTADEFVQFYPYPPHFMDLSIDIMSGIRLQPGAQRQIGGGNRTIIKQAYEMLVSEKTNLADQPVGTLVTLDRLYDLVEGSIASEKQLDINQIRESFRDHADDPNGYTLRTAKCLCLLEFVRGLPRTASNIAACLVDQVGYQSPADPVRASLERLEAGQFIRNTDEGWKLQTAYEKHWDTERRGYLAPKLRDQNEILREALRDLFAEPDLKTFRHKHKTLKVAVTLDGIRIGDDGDIPLALVVGDTQESYLKKREETRADSRQKASEMIVFWVFAMTPEIDLLVARLYASRQMIARYEQSRAQNQINHDDAALLQAEKSEEQNHRSRLREKVETTLTQGVGIFRGLEREGPGLGAALPAILRKQFEFAMPDLYAKFDMGVASIKASDIEDMLKAANLNGLPAVLYSGDGGLNLVIQQEGGRYVVNTSAPVAQEVLNFLQSKHAYGDKVTGRVLDDQFTGLGYGWDRGLVQLILASLLRAGAIEVTHQGRRYRTYSDPQVREPFTNQTAFKAASFAPRASIDLKTLTVAVRQLEDMTGEEVDIEEGAIASAFQKLADEELRDLLPVLATMQAHRLPGTEALREYRDTLNGVLSAPSDDCVRILAGEGNSFKEARKRLQQIQRAVDDAGLATIEDARVAVDRMAPQLRGRADALIPANLAEQASGLTGLIEEPTFYNALTDIRQKTDAIRSAFQAVLTRRHELREETIKSAIDQIKNHPYWLSLDPGIADAMLEPLTSRHCESGLEILDKNALECGHCRATLRELDSDIQAAPGFTVGILAELDRLAAKASSEDVASEGYERVSLSSFFPETLTSEAALEAALSGIRDYVLQRLHEGVIVTFS